MSDHVIDFTPARTVEQFMLSDAFFRLIAGPVGSAKTTGCIFEIVRRAALQEPAPDGYRYTRWAIVRQTLSQLKMTILKDVLAWFPKLANWKVSDSTIYLNMGDIRCELILLPLENPEDQKRLLSSNLTGIWMSEGIEMDVDLIPAISARCGRYPTGPHGVCTWSGIIVDTNLPSEGDPWHQLMIDPSEDQQIFIQPSGLSAEAENLQWLLQTTETLKLPEHHPLRRAQGRKYYERLARSNNDNWVARYVRAEFAPDPSGSAVYAGTFRPSFHIVDELLPIKGKPLIVGQDFGRDPWGVILQEDHRGRILVLEEIAGENTGLTNHCRITLRPRLMNPRYLGLSIVIVGDPAGESRSQYDELTAFDILKAAGFSCVSAKTNDPETRIRAVESYLLQQRDGIGAILFDRSRCPKLLQAMNGMYRYTKTSLGVSKPKPDKNEWSHVSDALQYGCLAMGGTQTAQAIARKIYPRGRNRAMTPISAAGWT